MISGIFFFKTVAGLVIPNLRPHSDHLGREKQTHKLVTATGFNVPRMGEENDRSGNFHI